MKWSYLLYGGSAGLLTLALTYVAIDSIRAAMALQNLTTFDLPTDRVLVAKGDNKVFSIFFPKGDSKIGNTSRDTVNALGTLLTSCGRPRLTITGSASEEPFAVDSDRKNADLANNRAREIKALILNSGYYKDEVTLREWKSYTELMQYSLPGAPIQGIDKVSLTRRADIQVMDSKCLPGWRLPSP